MNNDIKNALAAHLKEYLNEGTVTILDSQLAVTVNCQTCGEWQNALYVEIENEKVVIKIDEDSYDYGGDKTWDDAHKTFFDLANPDSIQNICNYIEEWCETTNHDCCSF